MGDRNAGAANVFREVNRLAGIGVGVCDAGKGVAALFVARFLGTPDVVALFAGTAAVIGHNWPLFLRFRGGRGAATTAGILLTLMPREVGILFGVAAIPFFLTRNIILACGFFFAPLPLVAWLLGENLQLILYSIGLPCLVGFTHYITTRHLPEVGEKPAHH